MILTKPEDVIEYTCTPIDHNNNSIVHRVWIMHRVNCDLMTVQSEAVAEIKRIANECMEALRK